MVFNTKGGILGWGQIHWLTSREEGKPIGDVRVVMGGAFITMNPPCLKSGERKVIWAGSKIPDVCHRGAQHIQSALTPRVVCTAPLDTVCLKTAMQSSWAAPARDLTACRSPIMGEAMRCSDRKLKLWGLEGPFAKALGSERECHKLTVFISSKLYLMKAC